MFEAFNGLRGVVPVQDSPTKQGMLVISFSSKR